MSDDEEQLAAMSTYIMESIKDYKKAHPPSSKASNSTKTSPMRDLIELLEAKNPTKFNIRFILAVNVSLKTKKKKSLSIPLTKANMLSLFKKLQVEYKKTYPPKKKGK